jgi:hypothetical protein
MPTLADQFVPDDALLDEFLNRLLYPKIHEFEGEDLQIGPVEVVVVTRGTEETVVVNDKKRSTCKVAFYRTFKPNRYVVKSSVRLVEKAINSGLSGFNLNGDINSSVSKLKGFTLVYNNLEFGSI